MEAKELLMLIIFGLLVGAAWIFIVWYFIYSIEKEDREFFNEDQNSQIE